jgi:hypothetical protein
VTVLWCCRMRSSSSARPCAPWRTSTSEHAHLPSTRLEFARLNCIVLSPAGRRCERAMPSTPRPFASWSSNSSNDPCVSTDSTGLTNLLPIAACKRATRTRRTSSWLWRLRCHFLPQPSIVPHATSHHHE